jgi:hypothetical protein
MLCWLKLELIFEFTVGYIFDQRNEMKKMSYKGVDRKFRESSEIVLQQTFHFLSEFNTQAIEHDLMKLLLRLLFVILAITVISICFYELLIFLFVIALYCRRSDLKLTQYSFDLFENHFQSFQHIKYYI